MNLIEDMEYKILEEGNYDGYDSLVSSQRNYDILRYMMAVSHSASECLAHENVSFIGGAGVLGNLVSVLGESVISKWRETHDLDILVRDRNCVGAIKSVLDDVDTYSPSLSIKNKSVLRGKSSDSNGLPLNHVVMDLYHPEGHPDEGMNISGHFIGGEHWKRTVSVPFFGIPVRVLNPMDLLNLKASVVCKGTSKPRNQDIQDLYHLFSVCQNVGYAPADVSMHLSPSVKKGLENLVPFAESNKDFSPVMRVDKDYARRSLL